LKLALAVPEGRRELFASDAILRKALAAGRRSYEMILQKTIAESLIG